MLKEQPKGTNMLLNFDASFKLIWWFWCYFISDIKISWCKFVPVTVNDVPLFLPFDSGGDQCRGIIFASLYIVELSNQQTNVYFGKGKMWVGFSPQGKLFAPACVVNDCSRNLSGIDTGELWVALVTNFSQSNRKGINNIWSTTRIKEHSHKQMECVSQFIARLPKEHDTVFFGHFRTCTKEMHSGTLNTWFKPYSYPRGQSYMGVMDN